MQIPLPHTLVSVAIAATHILTLASAQLMQPHLETSAPGKPQNNNTSTQEVIPIPKGPSPQPVEFATAAFDSHEGKIYLLNGGLPPNGTITPSYSYIAQFYSLDLSVSWSSEEAPWKKISPREEWDVEAMTNPGRRAPLISYMHSSHDSGLLALGSSPVSRFDYDDNRWESTAPSDRGRTYVTMNENAFVRGVTLDTNQGIVYGFGRSADDITPWQLTLFNARENKAEVLSFTYQHSAPESNSALEPIYDLTARKIYVFQHKSPTKDNAVYSFSTSDRKWTRMRTTGDVPGYRKDPCFISVGSGNALLVGGSGENFTPGTNTALKDAYLLRLSTGVWTRVADAPTAYHGASVCIYHPGSDTAILWGGRSSSINTSDGFNNGTVSQVKLNTGAPMIYNLQNNVWQPYFKAAVNNRPESDYARPINAASTLRPQNSPMSAFWAAIVPALLVAWMSLMLI